MAERVALGRAPLAAAPRRADLDSIGDGMVAQLGELEVSIDVPSYTAASWPVVTVVLVFATMES